MKNYYKIKNRFWMLLLAITGFASACRDVMDKYGMPIVRFIVKGTVTSSADNTPAQNISVSADSLYYPVSDTTDSKGNYSITFEGNPPGNQLHLSCTDTDSSANGSFSSKDTTITLSGTTEEITTRTINFKLDPKK